jgi:hypothetical protein
MRWKPINGRSFPRIDRTGAPRRRAPRRRALRGMARCRNGSGLILLAAKLRSQTHEHRTAGLVAAPTCPRPVSVPQHQGDFGGEGGIRTPDTVARMPHFECGAFNHSATSPGRTAGLKPGRYVAASARPDKGAVESRCVIPRIGRGNRGLRARMAPRGRDRTPGPPYDPAGLDESGHGAPAGNGTADQA